MVSRRRRRAELDARQEAWELDGFMRESIPEVPSNIRRMMFGLMMESAGVIPVDAAEFGELCEAVKAPDCDWFTIGRLSSAVLRHLKAAHSERERAAAELAIDDNDRKVH